METETEKMISVDNPNKKKWQSVFHSRSDDRLTAKVKLVSIVSFGFNNPN